MTASSDQVATLRTRVIQKLADFAGVPREMVRHDATLDSLGLDSGAAVLLAMEIEIETGREVDPALFLRFPTIGEAADEIARFLSTAAGVASSGREI